MSAVARWLEHITLTTGHRRRSYRDEISDEAITVCRMLIGIMAAGETVPIPGQDGYSLAGRVSGKCLVANVFAGVRPAEWTGGASYGSICTIGIAAHSKCGAALWRILHEHGSAPVVTDPDRCPPEPWVAAALDAGIAEHMEAAHWLGDFERCLAWAWLAELRGAD